MRTIISLLLIFGLLACENPKPKEYLPADLYLRVDSGRVKAEAKFNDRNGRSVILQKTPTLNGKPMELLAEAGNVYLFDAPGKDTEKFKFEWKDPSGDSTLYTVQPNPISDFFFDTEPLKAGEKAFFKYEGKPIQDNETLLFFWEKVGGDVVTMETKIPPSTTTMFMPPSEMKKLSKGEWSLYLVRKQRINDINNPFPVVGNVEFYTQSKTFEVH